MRILVVDDLLANIKFLENCLEKMYYQVFSAVNGQEALKMLEGIRPDVIIMDAVMPKMSGFTATRIIKGNPNYAHIPIIMVTALDSEEDKIKGLMAGADDLQTKPLDREMLLLRVRSLSRLKSLADSLHFHQMSSTVLNDSLYMRDFFTNMKVLKEARIMLIGSKFDKMNKYKEMLENEGMNVSINDDYNLALKQLASSNLHRSKTEIGANESHLVILGEMSYDEMLKLTAKIKNNCHTRDVLVMTIFERDKILSKKIAKAFELGVDDYIISPINQQEMLARCLNQIKKYRFLRILQSSYFKQLSTSTTDHLTKLYNRGYFELYISNIIKANNNQKQSLFLLMLDIDNLKNINDEYGHVSGDQILQETAARIIENLRITDMCARWGGDEFVIVLQNVTAEEGKFFAQKIRKAISSEPFAVLRNRNSTEILHLKCTCSIGGGMVELTGSTEDLIDYIDQNLYTAKSLGKNTEMIR